MDNIVLYGTGIIAEKFYYSYSKEYQIVFCIDSRKRDSFHGLECYSLEDAIERLNDELIVVAATEQSYKEIKQKLLHTGMQEFKDYVWSFEFNKELALLYGNCHMGVLREFLFQTPDFSERYTIRIKMVHSDITSERVPDTQELKKCTLFIAQDIRDENSAGVPSSKKLADLTNEKCTCIIIPNLFGINLFFPQFNTNLSNNITIDDHINNIKSTFLTKKYFDDRREIGLLECVDQNVYSVAMRGGGIQECLSMMLSDDHYDAKQIRDAFHKQITKVIEREKECDIKISDYILENYRRKQLFYDPEHPSEDTICEKGRRILKILGMKENDDAVIPRMLNSTELFIYDSVRNALNLEYRQERIRLGKSHAVLSGMGMNRKEYVEQMLKWNYKL